MVRLVKVYLFFVFLFFASKNLADSSILTLELKSESQASIEEVTRILEFRLKKIKPGFLSSVNVLSRIQHKNQIEINFSNWFPAKDTVNSIIEAAGKFEVSLIDNGNSKLLFTDKNILEVDISENDSTYFLNFAVDEHAQSIMKMNTSRVHDKFVEVRLDDALVNRFAIAGPISKYFSLSMSSKNEAEVLSAVLTGGRLPEATKLINLSWSSRAE